MAPKRTPVKKLFADKESENVQENSPATNQAAAPISNMHQDFMRFLEAQEANREAERLDSSNQIYPFTVHKREQNRS